MQPMLRPCSLIDDSCYSRFGVCPFNRLRTFAEGQHVQEEIRIDARNFQECYQCARRKGSPADIA